MAHLFNNRKLGVSNVKLSIVLVIIILINLSSCSTTHGYKTLSFFFDGVPNPEKQNTIQSKDTLRVKDTTNVAQNLMSAVISKMHFHPPYKDQECSNCHDPDRMGQFTKPIPELCYQCHDDFSAKYKVLHGPVGGGQCVMCHSPHQSINEKLLLRTGQALCLYCHNPEQVMASEEHRDIKDTGCTDCHNPHGGNDKFILR